MGNKNRNTRLGECIVIVKDERYFLVLSPSLHFPVLIQHDYNYLLSIDPHSHIDCTPIRTVPNAYLSFECRVFMPKLV